LTSLHHQYACNNCILCICLLAITVMICNISQLPNDANFTEPLPVMVWIAGGGFTLGTSIGYGSKYFMDEDVVLVAVNYRLGAFGK